LCLCSCSLWNSGQRVKLKTSAPYFVVKKKAQSIQQIKVGYEESGIRGPYSLRSLTIF
jgi:hypothetical protein